MLRNSPLRNARASKREKRDQGIARMFIIIVMIFFICNTPRMILNSVEVIVLATGSEFSEGWPSWWVHTLVLLNDVLKEKNICTENLKIYTIMQGHRT